MNNGDKQIDLIDDAWANYQRKVLDKFMDDTTIAGYAITNKEEFINKVKTDEEFSKRWDITIETRELSLEERIQFYYKRDCSNGKSMPYKILKEELKSERTIKMLDKLNIPTKLTTITYNGQTQESYE